MKNLRGEMPFLDHLEELRWRLLWSVVSVVVGALAGFGLVYYFEGVELLLAPIRTARNDPNLQLIYLSPADPFFVTLKLAIYVGVLFALPIVWYHIWSFLSPALDKREKRAIVPALYLGVVLFIAGASLAYFAALPVTLKFFANFEGASLQSQLEINATIGFVVKLLIAFGAVFELPIFILVLSVIGVVTPKFLRTHRRHAIVGITVLASFITPGDAITLTVMMMFPLILLYELGIFLSVLTYRGKARRERELEADLTPPQGSVQAQ